MGNSESTAPPETSIDDFDGVDTLGYRVLGVQPNSPASAAGLVSFFDFLIGADQQMLLGSGENLQEGDEYDDVDFPALLEKFKGRPLQLLVWNIKCQQQRLVDITPSDDWEGAGLLGVTIRLDNYAGAENRLIRILSVEHNSPAAIAGLVEAQDYLLGTTTHSFDSTKVLAAVLEAHVDKVVELYVYNTNSDKVRVVALMPTWSWGGNGLLGAEVGTGYLHRIPGSCRSTLGGSVERRVRWIGGSKNNGPPNSGNKGQRESKENLQQLPQLELEPQLEMEQPEDSEEEEHLDPQRQSSMGTVSLSSQVAAIEQIPSKEEETAPPAAASQPEPVATENGSAPPTTPVKEEAPNSGGSGVFIAAPKEVQNLPPTTLPPTGAPAPAPFPLAHTPKRVTSSSSFTNNADPNAQPITVTTFIPGPKPPPLSQSMSAEDLFSGPPPKAKISTTSSVVINSPVPKVPQDDNQLAATPQQAGTGNGEFSTPQGEFMTPHPPSAIKDAAAAGGVPPTPPVPQPLYGNGIDDTMPPPPKMSGAI